MRTNMIPVKGPMGLVFVVAVLLILLVAVPATRWFLLISLSAGALVGVILYLLRSQDR